ncbi:hypothetical protein ACPPVT_05765 [Angustibacter sp. McL0619]|uniref:hypothetical protein n=1 Tax=Angustibacter sp. McL0619 TaxID=3415676 RepID=UPI003CECF149
MDVLAWVLTIMLLFEVVPSAIAGVPAMGVARARFEELTRIPVTRGERVWLLRTVGAAHCVGAVLLLVGLNNPPVGALGAALELVAFGWILAMQLRHGDRGRSLFAYSLFSGLALAVLVVNLLR